jgi:excisionase family DNA binding protein
VNKKEAAEFLQVSEKTIERYKSAGRLSARMRRITGADGKSRQILDFNETDLNRLKRELSNEIIYPEVTPGHPQTKTQTDTDRQTLSDNLSLQNESLTTIRQTQTDNLISTILERLERVFEQQLEVSTLQQKMMLDINEASTLSGLSKHYLRLSIKEERLKAKLIGRTWKIKRQDLDTFIKDL